MKQSKKSIALVRVFSFVFREILSRHPIGPDWYTGNMGPILLVSWGFGYFEGLPEPYNAVEYPDVGLKPLNSPFGT